MISNTFQQYIEADLARAVIDHSLRAQRDCEGRTTFYLHPTNVDGETPAFRVEGNQLVPLNRGSELPTEHELELKGLTAARITPDRVEGLISSEYFHVPPYTTLTICVLTLANGYTVTGESACASPANFDPDIGRRYARDDAKRKIWALEGDALRNQLIGATAG